MKYVLGTFMFLTLQACGQHEVFVPGPPGAPGTPGTNGDSAGVLLSQAPAFACANGGTEVQSFIDSNNNGQLDAGETVTSTAFICNGLNGTNGQDGQSATISLAQAPPLQCPSGGTAISTTYGGANPASSVVCNGGQGAAGSNGTDGTNAVLSSGPVGSLVSGNLHACHHDFLYLNNGWLLFRHEDNGTADEGAGSTGFDVWDVQISDFLLVSEVGNVTYCTLHFDTGAGALSYTVNTNENGKAGETGTIQLH